MAYRAVCVCVCVRVCPMGRRATLLGRAQLSANRFHCCGITDNPGRFDSKSTQVTRALRRTDERRERGRWRESEEKGKSAETEEIKCHRAIVCRCLNAYCTTGRICLRGSKLTANCNGAVNDVNDQD